MDREAALKDFESARGEFEQAFATIPDEALGYLKPGDDYALGRLLLHVNWVLIHHERLLHGILSSGSGEFRAVDPEAEVERTAEQTRAGIDAGEREGGLSLTDQLHKRVRERFEGVSEADWERKAPVYYGADAPDTYPTSPADVAGWLCDHYREHVPQIADLVATWRQTA